MGQAVIYNPYVTQIEKFADSLEHISEKFVPKKGHQSKLTHTKLEEILEQVQKNVCYSCEKCRSCQKIHEQEIRQMTYEILLNVESYGVELSMEMKRRLLDRCVRAPRFLRETLNAFEEAKRQMAWVNRERDDHNRYTSQVDLFTHMLKQAAEELEAGIFTDARLERKVEKAMQDKGVRLIDCVMYMTKSAHYEVHLTAKLKMGQCMTVKEMAEILSESMGAVMLPGPEERPVLTGDYSTIVFVERPELYTMQGVAKRAKGCADVSGDQFLMKQLGGGRQAAILSDGMGAGEQAGRESSLILETLEELLDAGFSAVTAVELLNSALLMGRDEIAFSTLDMVMLNLYEKTGEWIKAGAAPGYIKRGDNVFRVDKPCIPMGVMQEMGLETVPFTLKDGDYLIMVTDGVLDALPVEEQETLFTTLIAGTDIRNPEELARHLLEQVLHFYGKEPQDDMLVLVVGVWKET